MERCAPFPCAAEHDKVATFTVAELGEMLPGEAYFEDGKSHLKTWRDAPDLFGVGYCWPNGVVHHSYHSYHENTEGDARARMLIHLIENDLVKS
jgi:hypothetical protein